MKGGSHAHPATRAHRPAGTKKGRLPLTQQQAATAALPPPSGAIMGTSDLPKCVLLGTHLEEHSSKTKQTE